MIDLSVIILNYNTKKLLLNCLNSIYNSKIKNYNIEIIVVDNNSVDGSVDAVLKFKKLHQSKSNISNLKLIKNTQNIGFAAGNNRGVLQARGRYILFLNSDTVLEKNTLQGQIKFMDTHPDYVASTCFVYLKNGKIDPASHRGEPTPWSSFTYFAKLEKLFPKSKLFGQYHHGWQDLTKVHAVPVVTGAFMMVKKKILDQIGLFDEAFFMYAEDVDLCLRINKAGHKIGFNPKVKVLHLKGQSGRSKKSKSKANYYFWQTMKIFYKKHYYKKYFKPFSWVILKILDNKQKKYV